MINGERIPNMVIKTGRPGSSGLPKTTIFVTGKETMQSCNHLHRYYVQCRKM